MIRLLQTDNLILELDTGRSLLRLTRTADFASAEQVAISAAALAAKFDTFVPANFVCLIDLRAVGRAPPDSAVEKAVTQKLMPVMGRLKRRAMLVNTGVGKLQTQRVAQSNTFSDEAEALKFLFST